MNQLEVKSTGTLVDEMYTTELKIAAGNEEAKERRHILGNVVMGRMKDLVLDMPKHRQFQAVMRELRAVLKECWDAQEIVMKFEFLDFDNIYIVAKAAKVAQETNAHRNRLIRQLDELIGETDRTQLGKTYDKDSSMSSW